MSFSAPARSAFVIALGFLLIAPHTAADAEPHQHGVAALDVAVEARKITLQLQAPLDNLLGYERAPRTEAERKQAGTMVATLRASGALFRIDPAAQCVPGVVALSSAALKLGPAAGIAGTDGHADLDGSFEFDCADAGKAAYIEVALFTSFPRMQRLEVQLATPRGQFQRNLKRPATRIALMK